MAYDYDTDILAVLWTGAEDGEQPYADIIAANPTLFDEPSENRILSTIEALRSHMEVLQDRDEARLFHFCMSTMLEGFGSGGFLYGGTSDNINAVVEGNVPNPTFVVGDEIELWNVEGSSGVGGIIGLVAATGTDLDTVIADINGAGLTDALGGAITAERTPDARLRIVQAPEGSGTPEATLRAAGFIVVRGGGDATAANTNITTKAGIVTQAPGALVALNGGAGADDIEGGLYLPKVTSVANAARDRALRVFLGQIRDPALN